jgi:hypothetical protein
MEDDWSPSASAADSDVAGARSFIDRDQICLVAKNFPFRRSGGNETDYVFSSENYGRLASMSSVWFSRSAGFQPGAFPSEFANAPNWNSALRFSRKANPTCSPQTKIAAPGGAA